MKKIFAVLIAVLMLTTLSVPALAANYIDGNGATSASDKEEGDYTLGVYSNYLSANTAKLVSVDIAWDAMDFTYTVNMKYNPDNHQNEADGPGSWSTNTADITVTNHSNAYIRASFAFTGATTDITGTFSKESFLIESANNAKYQTVGTDGKYPAPSEKTTFGLDNAGAPLTENKKLGTITVKLEQDTKIYTFEDLQAALIAGNDVKLGADIEVTDTRYDLKVDGKTVTLDLNGHTLKRSLTTIRGVLEVTGSTAALTVKDSSSGAAGKILNAGEGVCIDAKFGASVTVESVTAEATNGNVINISGGSKVTLNGGTLRATGNYKNGIHFNDTTAGNQLAVTGGTVIATDYAISVRESGVATVSGGNFTGELNIATGATLTVTGGTFSVDPSAYVDTSAYTVTEDNGAWTVTANAD